MIEKKNKLESIYLAQILLYNPEKKQDKRKIVSAGRRCGKTGLVHHTIIESLPVSNEKKKELHELYEKAFRGEE